jgi:prevent-host-death family protein
MKTAGIREARQNLSELIDEVRKGREIVITDRGRPVARLAPPLPDACRPFRSHSAFRRGMPVLDPPVSSTIEQDRDDRI